MDAIDKIIKLHDAINVADDLDDELLKKIGSKVVNDYKLDRESRIEWEKTLDEAMKIAKQTMEEKTEPWPGCANVKFPLMSFGAIQFAARVYPELIKDGRVVEAYVSGDDPDGSRRARAKNISAYMSYQLLIDNEDWESDTDRLFHMLPIVGTVFRKTYYDPIREKPCSELCDPRDVVIHNSARSIETARRVTHVLHLYSNDIIERINAGIYKDIDINVLIHDSINGENSLHESLSDPEDEDRYHDILEQHCYFDLDDDGYKEPYVVTVHLSSMTVLRIVSRWDDQGVSFVKDKKVKAIKAVNYFTDYHFIPNPDGSFYSLGFGTLLLPINESINSLYNQLLDAGTLANLQSGFLGAGLRVPQGIMKIKPGEWKQIPAMGGDLQSNIYPLPVKEPSQTLFQLLQALIQVGKDLTGVIDIMPEDQQTQNVPATTMLAMLDQRLKPLKAVFKRIYRAFKKEFNKLYRLNSIYLPDEQVYFTILNNNHAISKEDFKQPNYDVKPIADPSMSSETQRIMRVQMNKAALAEPGGAVLKVDQIMHDWLVEINGTTNVDHLMQPEPPKTPDPALIEIQAKVEEIQTNARLKAAQIEDKSKNTIIKAALAEQKIKESNAKIEKIKTDSVLDIEAAKHRIQNKDIEYSLNLRDKDLKEKDLLIKDKKAEIDSRKVGRGNN